jgi:hypothetical protein
MGVMSKSSVVVTSAAAPWEKSHLATGRWPFAQAMNMGVAPPFFAVRTSPAAPFACSHLHTARWPLAQAA